jgi:hypothetical protein
LNDLKSAIKESMLKIDLGVLDNGEFDPSCIFCTIQCTIACLSGCAISSTPGPVPMEPQ